MKLEYTSPSQMVLFKANMCKWLLTKQMGVDDPVGPAAWTGKAVESGLDIVLTGDKTFSPRDKAMMTFEAEAQGEVSDKIDEYRALVYPMLDEAIDATTELPRLEGHNIQFNIRHFLDGVNIPIVGRLDYEWPEFIMDLKTTKRIPSEPKPDHVLQVSIYAAARQKGARLLYVSGKKHQWFTLTDEQIESGLADARRVARAMVALCERYETPEEASKFMVPDFSDFRWSDITKAKALEVWT